MEYLVISLCFTTVSAALLTLCSLKMLQIMQLSSYQAAGYARWLKRTKFDYAIRYSALAFLSFAGMFIFAMCFPNPASWARYIGILFYIGLSVLFFVLQQRQKQKTPLKFTKRIVRQLIFLSLLYAALSFLAVFFTIDKLFGFCLLGIVPVLIPLAVLSSHFALLPLEKLIACHFKRKAAKTLAASGAIKIGITGSYGKTTAKNILAAILSKKYRVLASPSSHNTPMGLCKLINGGSDGIGLTDCDVLIAEMGARHPGDIAELCRLVKPDYGIITVTGVQHLETFGSVENIVKTKLELAAGARRCIINADDKRLLDGIKTEPALAAGKERFLYSGAENGAHNGLNGTNIASGANIVTVMNGVNNMNGACDDKNNSTHGRANDGADCLNASYRDVRVTGEGTSFIAIVNGETIKISTPLLGRHIPALVTQCALLASALGVPAQDITTAAAGIKQVPHRLELIKTPNGLVIDDSYNSNPDGAKNALEVLSMFEGDRVVITPGFVELGQIQDEKNTELGAQAAGCADYCIFVKNTQTARGALQTGMREDRVLAADSLEAAMGVLNGLKLKNPVVLFLNDLPDNY